MQVWLDSNPHGDRGERRLSAVQQTAARRELLVGPSKVRFVQTKAGLASVDFVNPWLTWRIEGNPRVADRPYIFPRARVTY